MNKFLQKGQIAVFAVLMGLLGLTIALGAASRSLSDLRQVNVVDSGIKGLAAAEAGLEFGLNQLATASKPSAGTCAGVTGANLNLSGIKPYSTDVNNTGITYQICANTPDFASLPTVAKDDVWQVNLSDITAANVKSLSVLWKNPNASLEIIKVDANNNLTRYIYNGTSVTTANGFAQSISGSNCVNSTCADSTYNSGSCTGNGEIPLNNGDKLIRFRLIYASSDIAICAQTSGNSPGRLSLQYYTITATAKTTSGAVKKVQTSQIVSALPAIFDNVFFTGGDLAK